MHRSRARLRVLALHLLPVTVVATFPRAVLAQALQGPAGMERERSGEALPSMSVGLPSATEVPAPERPLAHPADATARPALESPLDPDLYVCGQGDVFELNFWGAQNFKLRATVDVEGRLFIGKVGYVELAGKTLSEARAASKKAVTRYYPGLNFEISLIEPRTFLVHVVENVVRPGTYSARPIERVDVALRRAGGILGEGSRRRIVIERRNGARLPVDLVRFDSTGDTRYVPYLLDGDVVRVPFADLVVAVGGAVQRPGRYELTGSKDLKELLGLSGGFSSAATRQLPLRVQRRDSQEHFELIAVPQPGPVDSIPEMQLQRDDVVTVPSVGELQRSVLLVGAISGATATDEATAVRRIDYVEGDTVRTLIERAGGVLPAADLSKSYLTRGSGKVVAVDLDALLVRRDLKADLPVALDDTLTVPFKRRGVMVEGAVFHPGAQPFNPAFGFSEYLAAAGGPTKAATSLDQARIVSVDGRTFPYEQGRPPQPGDTMVMPEQSWSRSEIVTLITVGAGILLSGATLYFAAHK